MVNPTDTSVDAILSKDSTTNNLQQSDNKPYYESDNGAGDNIILPARSSSKVPKDANDDNSSPPADIAPKDGETELEFYESDNGSEGFVDLDLDSRLRKKKEKISAEVIEDVEAADVEYESDNGSGDEVVLPPIKTNLEKEASA